MSYQRVKPTKCTKKFLQSYEKLILTGTKPLTAARVCGIKDSTFYDWLREAKEHSEERPAASLILEFLEITERARAEFIAATMAKATLHISSTSDALAVLRTSAPEEFADKSNERQDLTINQLIVNIVKEVANEQLAALETGSIDAEFTEAEEDLDDEE